MNPFASLYRAARSALGYDIVEATDRRKVVSANIRSEDMELLQEQRRQLIAQANDCMRNFAIARWAVGKHLDFVARHSFSCQTGNTLFDKQLGDLMEEWMNDPRECDITARHTFDRLSRMTEARATIAGDHLLLKLKSGQLQQIETDRLRDEMGTAVDGSKIAGIWMDPYGKALSYRIWERELFGGYTNPVQVPADCVCFHAHYPNERSDQVRGIGLITAGLSDFCDAYEWADLTKAASKLRTAFGVIITSEALDGVGNHSTPSWEAMGNEENDPSSENDDIAVEGEPRYTVDLGRGPFKLEMDPGEDLKFVTDTSPSQETFQFFKATIGFALKALDIPLCFYDEGLTNFFGQRAALSLYLESCKPKRKNLVLNVLRPTTNWKIVQWVAQGRLILPANGPIHKVPFAWHPAGTPYWNPIQEITADLQAIRGGLGNFEDVYLERTGRDWFNDMRRLKHQQDFLKEIGVELDPAVIQLVAIGADPSQFGNSNPLADLPKGGLAI